MNRAEGGLPWGKLGEGDSPRMGGAAALFHRRFTVVFPRNGYDQSAPTRVPSPPGMELLGGWRGNDR
jgi:hypothetical protein